MKTLSYYQPWAWLVAMGIKPIENRPRVSHHRGPVLIHAAKKYDDEGEAWVRENFPEIPLPPKELLPRGGIVGTAVQTDCVTESESPWFLGPYGYVMKWAYPVPFEPVPGRQGWFENDYPVGERLANPGPCPNCGAVAATGCLGPYLVVCSGKCGFPAVVMDLRGRAFAFIKNRVHGIWNSYTPEMAQWQLARIELMELKTEGRGLN